MSSLQLLIFKGDFFMLQLIHDPVGWSVYIFRWKYADIIMQHCVACFYMRYGCGCKDFIVN